MRSPAMMSSTPPTSSSWRCPVCASGGEDRTLREWLRALPEDVVRRRALLATQMAWARLSEGDLDGVAAWLDDARDRAQEAGATPGFATHARLTKPAAREEELRGLPATIEMFRASLAQARGDVDGTVVHARRALDLAGPDDHLARAGARRLPRPGCLGRR